eukprot:TRINITY_DN10203_c0_g1_i1.p2 TRINITY_DN10203_c0_g1~~TRINITY_DN10203_c0_g1_i1.p2  ORF type:complete len:369 (+),score=89.55 TRINITY_DN10203_c0_g1_i1:1953-3059(+)
MPPKSRQSRVDPKKALKQRAKARRAENEAKSISNQQISPSGAEQPSFPSDSLLNQAETLQTVNPDAALQFIDRALETEPDNTRALEMKAMIKVSLDQPLEARQLLERCIELEPHSGWSKFLFLGQMADGQEAATMLSQGIQLLADHERTLSLKADTTDEDIASLHEDISAAFCSLAEVYLTDLCEEPEAQDTCLALMEQALNYAPSNVEALQTLASIKISTQEPEEAKILLMRSLEYWWYPLQDTVPDGDADNNDKDDDNGDDSMNVAADVNLFSGLPPYEFRINTVKLLLELGEHVLAAEMAAALQEEDDTIMQVWYLQGWALYLMQDADCKAMLEQARTLYHTNNCERPDVLAHIDELLTEVDKAS